MLKAQSTTASTAVSTGGRTIAGAAADAATGIATRTAGSTATRTAAILIAAVMALVVALAAGGVQKAYAANDLTQHITITSVEVFDSDGQSIPLNQGDDANSYSSGLAMGENGKFQFTWSIDTGTSQIQAGDTVTLPITTSFLRFNPFTETDIYGTVDGSDQKIGTIQKVGGDYDGNLIITFSDAAVGHNSITDGHFSTGNVLRRAGSVQNGTVRSFTFNGSEYKYLAEPSPLTPIPKAATKWQDGHSSTNVRFGIIPFRSIERDLTDVSNASNITDEAWVNTNLRHSDVFIEDVIDDSGVSSVSINGITVPIYVPLEDTVSTSANNSTIGWVGITRFFTAITQQDGETTDAFRTRVKSSPLQYGVYEENGVFTVMINLGDWPTQTLTYDNTNVTRAVNNAPNTNDFWNDDRVALWKKTHLDSALNGEITTPAIYVNVVYDKPVVVETQKTNTAQLYMDGKEPTNMSARGTLLPTTQTAAAKAGEVQIIKMDADTNEALSGVEFELERHDGTDWTPHVAIGGNSTWKTDANGSVIISGLIGGNEYRLVETAAPDGYDKSSLKLYTDTSLSTQVNSFTVDSSKGLAFYATNEKAQAPATYGDVVIQKKLAGNDAGSGTSKAFEFTVTAKDKDGTAIEGAFGDADFANGTATVTITGEGTATIAGLPDGATYTIEEADYTAEGWDAVSWDAEPVDKTVAGASPNSSVTYTATNTRNTYGDVIIKKVETGNDAGKVAEFEFAVTAEDKDGNALTGTFGDATFASGEATVKVKAGQQAKVEGLPNGTKYSIAEKDYSGDGYDEVDWGATTPTDQTVVGRANGANSEVTFTATNNRDTYGDLVVAKAVAGNAADKTKAFDFTVTLTNADGSPLASAAVGEDKTDAEGKIVFSLKGGESKAIKGIPNGTKYEVAEADYSAEGYVTTKTGDAGTIAGGEDSSVTAEFTNTRNAAGSLTVAKSISGDAASKDDEFEFTITLEPAIDGTFSGVAFANGKATITLKGGQTKVFNDLPNGTKYTVEETDSKGYTPDSKTLSGTVDEKAAATASFTNTKSKPVDPDPKPGDPGSDPGSDPDTDPDPVDPAPDPEPKTPVLSISKTSTAKQAKPGDVVPYTITITNSGEADAQGVEVVDTMAEGLSYVEDDAGGKADGQKVTWVVDVPAGGSKTINIKCSIKESATGKVINSVAIIPSDGFEVEPQKEEDDETITISTGDSATFDPNAQEGEKSTPDKDPGKVVTTGTGDNKDTNTSAPKPSPSRTTTAATGDVVSPLALILLLVASGAALAASRTRRAKE